MWPSRTLVSIIFTWYWCLSILDIKLVWIVFMKRCPTIDKKNLGRSESDNNNRKIALTGGFYGLLRYIWTGTLWLHIISWCNFLVKLYYTFYTKCYFVCSLPKRAGVIDLWLWTPVLEDLKLINLSFHSLAIQQNTLYLNLHRDNWLCWVMKGYFQIAIILTTYCTHLGFGSV